MPMQFEKLKHLCFDHDRLFIVSYTTDYPRIRNDREKSSYLAPNLSIERYISY